jgi:hypothetical protein
VRVVVTRLDPMLTAEFRAYGGCARCGCRDCDRGPEGGASTMVRCSNIDCHAEYVIHPGEMVAAGSPRPGSANQVP